MWVDSRYPLGIELMALCKLLVIAIPDLSILSWLLNLEVVMNYKHLLWTLESRMLQNDIKIYTTQFEFAKKWYQNLYNPVEIK